MPEKMFDQSDVERHGIKQLRLVVIDELLLDGAIEPLGMSIHLGCFGVGVPVDLVEPFNLGIEVFHELTAVVRQDVLQGEREQERHELEELFGGLAGVTGGGPSEGPAGVDVGEGDDVAAGTMDVLLDGIEGTAVAGVERHEILRFPYSFGSFPLDDLAVVTNLHGKHPETTEVSDNVANGGSRGAVEGRCSTQGGDGLLHLLLAEVGVVGPLPFDLGDDLGWPGTNTNVLRPLGLLVQGFELTTSFLELALPVEEGTTFDTEGVNGRLETMPVPEIEDFGLVFGFIGEHTCPP